MQLTSDIFRSYRNINIQQFFDSETVALLVTHHRYVIQSIEIRQRLSVRFVFNQFFRATMEKTYMWVSTTNNLKIVCFSMKIKYLSCFNEYYLSIEFEN